MIRAQRMLWLAAVVAVFLYAETVFATDQFPVGELPSVFAPAGMEEHYDARRAWTIRDIVEVRRITDVAVCDQTHEIAFVLRQSSLSDGGINYALYITGPDGRGGARKITQASYLADLSWRPRTHSLTVIADLGLGAQLYEFDNNWKPRALLVNRDTAVVGGNDGVTVDAGAPHRSGIRAYEWAPEGQMFWYSKVRLRSAPEQEAIKDSGVLYDDRRLELVTLRRAIELQSLELHVYSPSNGADRVLVDVHTTPTLGGTLFTREMGFTSWSADSRRIQYRRQDVNEAGGIVASLWDVDARSGELRELKAGVRARYNAIPLRDQEGYLAVESVDGERRLLARSRTGSLAQDFGVVTFERLGEGRGAWWNGTGDEFVLGVHYPGRDGLFVLPEGPATKKLGTFPDTLNHCSFSADLSFGACVREAMSTAPELASISIADGKVTPLVRPNAGYAELYPLRVERRVWRNRYGSESNGFFVYPRSRVLERAPVIVITHGQSANNTFADDTFQWEFPVQVFAEKGYLTLLVNEPAKTDRAIGGLADAIAGRVVNTRRLQFDYVLNPIAGMEAALKSVTDSGLGDPERTGIAGYSRGGMLTELVITHSKAFRVGSSGEGGGYNAGLYWEWGSSFIRELMHSMFGGSPYDPKAQQSYREASVSFRAREAAGPLLQQQSEASVAGAFELHELLEQAGVPSELAVYPGESHIFWQPRHRAAAMKLNLDWFDYWLLGRKDPDPVMKDEYERWDAMASRWRRSLRSAVPHVAERPRQIQ